MLADAAETEWIRKQAPADGGLRDGAEGRPVTIADGQRRRVDDRLRVNVDGTLDLREAEPIPRPQTQWPDRVRATLRRDEREAQDSSLVPARREAGADVLARRSRGHAGRFDALGQREPELEPGHRQRLAVRHGDDRRHRLARHQTHGLDLDARLEARERERSEEHTSELQSLAYLVC